MRGVDTNLLLRYFTGDDIVQSRLAAEFFAQCEAKGEPVLIASISLCELIWSLTGKKYRLGREDIAGLIKAILESNIFRLEDHGAVRRALGAFQNGPADFADYLVGEIHRGEGCLDTVTFDQDASLHPSFTLLTDDRYPIEPVPPSWIHEDIP
jgi:predicted nucleic-acid-binding protein